MFINIDDQKLMTTTLAYDKQCMLSYGDPEHIKHIPKCT